MIVSRRPRPRHALAAAIAVLSLLAPAAASADGSEPFAVGSGVSGGMHIAFAAHGGPTPLQPVSGHFEAFGDVLPLSGTNPTAFHFGGPVTCLTVVGNRAGLFYPLAQATPSAFQGMGVFISLTDNGNPSHGNPPDQIGFVGPVPIPATLTCPPGPTPMNLDHGNITIHDGS